MSFELGTTLCVCGTTTISHHFHVKDHEQSAVKKTLHVSSTRIEVILTPRAIGEGCCTGTVRTLACTVIRPIKSWCLEIGATSLTLDAIVVLILCGERGISDTSSHTNLSETKDHHASGKRS